MMDGRGLVGLNSLHVAFSYYRIMVGDNIDPYLCVYSNPAQTTPEKVGSSGYLLEISGFIPSPSIAPIFESLR